MVVFQPSKTGPLCKGVGGFLQLTDELLLRLDDAMDDVFFEVDLGVEQIGDSFQTDDCTIFMGFLFAELALEIATDQGISFAAGVDAQLADLIICFAPEILRFFDGHFCDDGFKASIIECAIFFHLDVELDIQLLYSGAKWWFFKRNNNIERKTK